MLSCVTGDLMSENEIVKVYIYTRVSTAMQVDGFSLSAQERKIEEFCKYKDYIIAGKYSDEGKSGSDVAGRENFQKMLFDIKRRKDNVKYVVVFKLSRFARNTRDALNSLNEMRENGVELIVTDENIDTSTDMGNVVMTILSTFAELELKNIHAQTYAGRVQKANEGKWNGGFAPYGYELKNGELVISPKEAKDVQDIFDLFVNTDMGYSDIAKKLKYDNRKKTLRPNATNQYFDDKFISKILKNEVYKGEIVYGRRTNIKKNGTTYAIKQKDESKVIRQQGIHQAIIDDVVWQKAQDKIDSLSKTRNIQEPKHIYVLSSLVKCPFCGDSMYGGLSQKKRKDGTLYSPSYNYSCKRKLKNDGTRCTKGKQFNAKEIDQEFARILSSFLFQPKFINEIQKNIDKGFDFSELNKKYDELKREEEQLNKKQQRLEVEIDNLDMDTDSYEQEYLSLSRRLKNICESKNTIKKSLKIKKEQIDRAVDEQNSKKNAFELIVEIGEHFTELTPIEQKKIARALVSKIELFPTKRAYGYIKSIYFSIPIISKEEIENQYTIWDEYPEILDEEGNFKDTDPTENSDNCAIDCLENEYKNVTEEKEIPKSIKPVPVSDVEGKTSDDFSRSIKRTVEAVALIEKINN